MFVFLTNPQTLRDRLEQAKRRLDLYFKGCRQHWSLLLLVIHFSANAYKKKLKRYPTILTRKWSFNTVMLNPKYTIPSQLCVLAVHCDFPYFDLQYWYSPPKKTELLLCHRGVYRRCSVCFCQSVEAGKSPHGNLQKYSFLNVFILE